MTMPKQNDPQFKLRLPHELKGNIEAEADRNNRSINAEVVARLEASFGSPQPLRDWFAGQALVGLITSPNRPSLDPPHDFPAAAAAVAYEYADAMIAERSK